jgi:two-component system sensor histidine kinase RegB
MLGAFAVACATVLMFAHYPLPWDSDDPLQLPPIYMIGVWLSILLAIGFIGVYAWQITEESRQLADALAATELVLAREQHLSQLDGLAAAAAHELGTPLSTISVIAKELENAIAAGAPHGDDVRLLREQATRCRDILAKLTELSSSGEPFDRTPLAALIEEVVAPNRNFGVAIEVTGPGARGAAPVSARNPAILYGLGNLVENAVDFASESVTVGTQWNEDIVEVTIGDDGPGFAPEIMDRIGEPYVTSRKRNLNDSDEIPAGLGLGLFIAKTLLERSGATLDFGNRSFPQRGAVVTVRWNRSDFERPLTFPPS